MANPFMGYFNKRALAKKAAFDEQVQNALGGVLSPGFISRLSGKAGQQYSGERDIYVLAGYPKTLQFSDYNDRYRRQDLAQRVVTIAPEWTWKESPQIRPIDPKDQKAADEINAWMEQRGFWSQMSKADRISGIGQFGGLLIGLDSDNPQEFALPVSGKLSTEDILYLQPFAQDSISSVFIDTSVISKTFNKPRVYVFDITLDSSKTSGVFKVDGSRVIHMSDGLDDSGLYGRPRMMPVFNRLMDLEKIQATTGEAFWETAQPGHNFTVDPDKVSQESFIEMKEEFIDQLNRRSLGMQKNLTTFAIKAENISGTVESPKDSFDVIASSIAAVIGVPKRILFGAEAGELASTQDLTTWVSSVVSRQQEYAGPSIVKSFVDRLMAWSVFGAFPYEIHWPSLIEESQSDQAESIRRLAVASREFATAELSGANPVTQSEFRERANLPKEKPETPGDPKENDDKKKMVEGFE